MVFLFLDMIEASGIATDAWIGLHDRDNDETYVFTDGTPVSESEKAAHFRLWGHCIPDQFCDCLCIFLKNYNTFVTSKICFLYR